MVAQSEGGPKVNIMFNLFQLKQQLHIAEGREWSYTEIARAAGLHRNTVERIAENKTGRVDLDTLAALLSFFHSKGMKVSLVDLLTVEIDGEQVQA